MTEPAPSLSARLHIKVTPDQLARWRAAALADGRDMSGWVRWVLDQAARQAEQELTREG